MQSNKIIIILIILVFFTVNSFFIIQIKRSVNSVEEENEAILSHYILHVRNQSFQRLSSFNRTTQKLVKQHSNKSSYIHKAIDLFHADYVREEANVNPQKFSYIINPAESLCGANKGQGLLLIAFVPISVGGFGARVLIRQTWARPGLVNNMNMKLVFILGKSLNKTISEEVKFESQVYGDIVQEDFMDTYKNLNLKTLAGLNWVSTYCSNARFTLKIDDDVVVNTPFLMNYLQRMNDTQAVSSNTFLCKRLKHKAVKRDPKVKFFISKDYFYPDEYPTYCDGPAYIFTTDIAKRFYEKSHDVKLFIWEDVYMGLLAAKLNSTFISLIDNYYRVHFFVTHEKPNISYATGMFIYSNNVNEYGFVWNRVYSNIRNGIVG